MNIFQITAEYRQLEEALIENGGEVTPELETALQINQEQLQEKGINYGYLIKSLKYQLDIVKAEKERIEDIKKRIEKTIDRLESTLIGSMELRGIIELKSPTLTINFRKSESVEITDFDALPKEYITVKTTEMPNKTEIKQAIKEGKVIAGAELRINNNLQIK